MKIVYMKHLHLASKTNYREIGTDCPIDNNFCRYCLILVVSVEWCVFSSSVNFLATQLPCTHTAVVGGGFLLIIFEMNLPRFALIVVGNVHTRRTSKHTHSHINCAVVYSIGFSVCVSAKIVAFSLSLVAAVGAAAAAAAMLCDRLIADDFPKM